MKKLTALVLGFVLAVSLTACESRVRQTDGENRESEAESEPPTETQAQPETPQVQEPETDPAVDTQSVRQAAQDLLEALQSGDREQIRRHIDYANLMQLEDGNSDANRLAILKHLRFEILDVQATENTATVQARLTNVDMNAIMSDYVWKAMEMEYNNYNNEPEEEQLSPIEMERKYEKLFEDMLDNSTALLERTVDLQLIQSGGEWRVQSTEVLREAALGDFFGASKATSANARG